MKRRSTLKTLVAVAGGSFLLSTEWLAACQSDTYIPLFFDKKILILIDEIGEAILPKTPNTPGAKAAKVAHFIDLYVADCYDVKQQQKLQDGLINFQKNCKARMGKPFLKLDTEQKHVYLIKLDKTANLSPTGHYFSLLKNLVLFAYFTSQEGATQSLQYLPIPGKYQGNYPFKQGDKAWAL